MAGTYFDIDSATKRWKRFAAIFASAGSGDANKLVMTDSTGYLNPGIFPPGDHINKSVVASEAIAAGAPVNLWGNAGVINMRNADATAEGKECDGFVNAAVSSLATGVMYSSGLNTGLTGLSIGAEYWLGTTAGTFTTTPGQATGNIIQSLGKATSATEMEMNIAPVSAITTM